MSKDTRVRVEFFSKIMPSTWPSSGISASAEPLGHFARFALRSCASFNIAAMASPPASDRFRQCLVISKPFNHAPERAERSYPFRRPEPHNSVSQPKAFQCIRRTIGSASERERGVQKGWLYGDA